MMATSDANRKRKEKKRVLAACSGGGHWVEMLRILPAFEEYDLIIVTVDKAYQTDLENIDSARFYCVQDVTRWNKIRWIQTAFQILWILVKERPDVVVSTGALPGFMAARLGKLLGAKTIWLDSIANVDELSASGEKIGPHADLWLTQWPHLASTDGPDCRGAVL